MPKQVDHDARRRRIAQALWRVASTQGLEGVSLRRIAAEAEVSMGQVQHYFRTKDEMLLFAWQRMRSEVDIRIQDRLAGLQRADEPQALTRAVLVEMLPLDSQRRAEGLVTLTFLARAPFEPDIGHAVKAGYDQLRNFLTEQLITAGTQEPKAARTHANELMALLEGITSLVLASSMDTDTALAVLDAKLAQAFAT